MNNKYLASLFCITVLALAPACKKRQEKAVNKDDVNTMIELDNSVFEVEDTTDEETVIKF
jgi:hypothetical protein